MKTNGDDRIKRGALVFVRKGEQVTCTLGEPGDPESEHVFTVHQSFMPDIIAGLTAMKRIT